MNVNQKLLRARLWLASKYRELPLKTSELRTKLAEPTQSVSKGIDPGNLVWIFGSGRSGSTWLRKMMSELDRHRVWEEPLVGRLFGEFYDRSRESNLRRPEFIMGDATRRGWLRSIRNFVLDGAGYADPRLGSRDYLVIKEPNGSAGAPLLMEALPESRMILLVRDPRDVIASTLDGARKGNWLHDLRNQGASKKDTLPDDDPDAFVRLRANTYLQQAGNARRAYEAHKGLKAFVRYEDLLTNTLSVMERLYSELEIPVARNRLARAVTKHAWENISEAEKGTGKFHRKASPGGWREDLTRLQIETIEKTTFHLLDEFYPGWRDERSV